MVDGGKVEDCSGGEEAIGLGGNGGQEEERADWELGGRQHSHAFNAFCFEYCLSIC